MSLQTLPKLNTSGNTYTIDGNRLTNGGVAHSQVGNLFTDLVNAGNATIPFTTKAVANGGTVNLTSTVLINVLRTTSDGTISGAIINLPTVGPSGSGALVDGQTVAFSTTGAITTVTGTVETGSVLPVVSTLAAGQVVKLRYNLAATAWFRV